MSSTLPVWSVETSSVITTVDRESPQVSYKTKRKRDCYEWSFGFTVINGMNRKFYLKEKLTPWRLSVLQHFAKVYTKKMRKATKRKATSRSRSTQRRPTAAQALTNMAYGAMGELVGRVNQEQEEVTA
jgi:hypothetical protein